MGAINISLNSDTKEFVVTIDGQVVSNVVEVSVFNENYYSEDKTPEYHMRLSTVEKVNGIKKCVTYMSVASESAKAALNQGVAVASKVFNGFVRKENNSFLTDKFLKMLGKV